MAEPPSDTDRLESWKEIAAYLKRDVRTVQRWEEHEQLPVYRHQHKKRGSVYALRPELDRWREMRRADLFGEGNGNGEAPPTIEASWRVPAGIALAGAAAMALIALFAMRPQPATGDPVVAYESARMFGELARDGGRVTRVPIAANGRDVVLSPDGATLYVQLCGPARYGLQAIDIRAKTVVWTSDFRHACGPLILSPDGGRLFTLDQTNIIAFDTRTRELRRIGTSASSLIDLTMTRDGRTLYVAASLQGLLSVDTRTRTVTTVNPLPCPFGVGLTPSNDHLFVTYQCQGPGGARGHDAIDVLDTRTLQSIGTILGLPNVGGEVRFSPDGTTAWTDGRDACAASHYDQVGCPAGLGPIINVIRTSDRQLLRTLRVQSSPEDEGQLLSFSPDGERLLSLSNNAVVLNTLTFNELESYPHTAYGHVAFARDSLDWYGVLEDPQQVLIVPRVAALAPPAGLTGRWLFDGTSTDSAGGNAFALVGPHAYAPGRVGLARRFGGSAPEARVPGPFWLSLDRQAFSAMAWVRFDDAAPTPMTVAEFVLTDSSGPFGWQMHRDADGFASLCIGRYEALRCASSASWLQGTTRLEPGVWYHFAITREGADVRLFVNTRQEAAARVVGDGPQRIEDLWLRIGSDEAGAAPLSGRVDEVEIYNRSLTLQELASRGRFSSQ